MNMQVKNLVGIMLAIGIPLFVGATVFSSYYDSYVNPASFRDFTVIGEGKTDVKPDIATLQLTVLTEGGVNVKELQKNNTEKMNKVTSFVKSKGVKDEDIATTNYSINPRYQYFDCSATVTLPLPPVSMEAADAPTATPSVKPEIRPSTKTCPPPAIVGYTISQSANVKVRDFAVIGELLSGATAQGANSISGPNFDLDELSVYQKTARDQAIQRAKEKAQQVADEGGFRLGRLISIDENVTSPNDYYAFGKGGPTLDAVSAAPAPQIDPGTQRVTVEARLRYEIK